MTEKRFTLWDSNNLESLLNTFVQDAEKGNQLLNHKECCDLLNELNEENQILKRENDNKKRLLIDELRGLFQMYLIQCRSISEEAIITYIKNDVKKRVFEVFDE